MRDLVSLPKVDLHVHLEGSFRPATLREIAAQNRHFLPPALRGDRFVFRDSQEFFELNGVVRDCLVREADFRRVAYELCEDAAAQGVRYMEPSFTLGAHAVRLGEWEMPLRAVLAGLADGEAAFGVGSQLILDHVRKRPAKLAWQTLDVARRYVDRGVVGLGLAGREEYSAAPFAEVFSAARTAGLHSVPHAGEMRGADSVREALELLGAERIGHGFRAMEDPELVAELRLRSIPLEVCPGSNVALGLARSLADHPFSSLRTAGLTVTLNSDVPTLFGTPLLGEYETARRVFGLDDAAIADVARAGVEASFADPTTRRRLLRDVDAWLAS